MISLSLHMSKQEQNKVKASYRAVSLEDALKAS